MIPRGGASKTTVSPPSLFSPRGNGDSEPSSTGHGDRTGPPFRGWVPTWVSPGWTWGFTGHVHLPVISSARGQGLRPLLRPRDPCSPRLVQARRLQLPASKCGSIGGAEMGAEAGVEWRRPARAQPGPPDTGRGPLTEVLPTRQKPTPPAMTPPLLRVLPPSESKA